MPSPSSIWNPSRQVDRIARDLLPPRLFLLGCRPLVPYHGFPPDAAGNDPPFHAPGNPERIGDFAWPYRRCPVCHGRSNGGPAVVCGWCHSTPDPERRERTVKAADQAAVEADQRRQRMQRETDRMTSDKTPVLSERERRYVTRKYGSDGRSWLRALGQLPTDTAEPEPDAA